MHFPLLSSAALSLILAGAASADIPSVAVDIAPVHSLVARVMQDVGTPQLILQPGASPHHYALRPSEAAMLQNADLVVWTGSDLTPWLEDPISTLAGQAQRLELLAADGTILLDFRDSASFEPHDHEHEHEHEHDHSHDHDHDHHHGHDPHAWLDPRNAEHWMALIAARLGEIDPDNADIYAANAATGQAELQALSQQIDTALAPVRDIPFIVFHDAYQYFENRFGVTAAGSISLADGSQPGPARIAQIRAKVSDLGVHCAFAEPQFNPGLIQTVFGPLDAHIGIIDPLGAELQPGPALYPQLLRDMTDSLTGCLPE